MKLIVGLGNPGLEYKETKHNVGFWVLDVLAERHAIRWMKSGPVEVGEGKASEERVLLAKPLTFMNRSGKAVSILLTKQEISLSDFIVIYDDVDLEIGRIRIRTKGRSGGHRGMESIIQTVGSDRFIRVRLGIGREDKADMVEYVLKPFRPADRLLMEEAVLRAAQAVEQIVAGKLSQTMNEYNRNVG